MRNYTMVLQYVSHVQYVDIDILWILSINDIMKYNVKSVVVMTVEITTSEVENQLYADTWELANMFAGTAG